MQVQALNDITKRFDIDVSSSGGDSGGGSSSGPILEWTQLAGPEDVFEYDSSAGNHVITIDDKFGCTTINNLQELCMKWVFVKWTYNGETKYSYIMPFFEELGNALIVEWPTTLTPSSDCEVMVYAEYADSVLSSVSLCVSGNDLPSDDTSGISIYAAEVTDWNE